MRHVSSGACFGQDLIVFASSVVVCLLDEIAVSKDETMSLQNAGLLMALCFLRNDRFLHVNETFKPKLIEEQQRSFCRSDAVISGWSEDQINCVTVNVCWSVDMLNDIE